MPILIYGNHICIKKNLIIINCNWFGKTKYSILILSQVEVEAQYPSYLMTGLVPQDGQAHYSFYYISLCCISQLEASVEGRLPGKILWEHFMTQLKFTKCLSATHKEVANVTKITIFVNFCRASGLKYFFFNFNNFLN